LVKVDGKDITSADDITKVLASNKKAASIKVEVWRAAEIHVLEIPLGRYP